MKKKRGLNVTINFSNRWLYTFIVLGILAIVGVGVYALVPGVAPNPGHLISEMAPPSPCTANQVLQFDGTNWKCADLPTTQGACPAGTTLYYNYINGSEDTYSAQSSGQSSGGTDTCDGVNNEGGGAWYICPANVTKTCRDYVYGGGFYYYRDVVCKKNMNLGCKEP